MTVFLLKIKNGWRIFWIIALVVIMWTFGSVKAQETSNIFNEKLNVAPIANSGLVNQEFRYKLAQADQVFFVWGINGWFNVEDNLRPAETIIKDRLMHTPMERIGDVFVTQIRMPIGTTIDFVFHITKTRDGDAIDLWDGRPPLVNYYTKHTLAQTDNVVEIMAPDWLVKALDKDSFLADLLFFGLIVLIGLCLVVFLLTLLNLSKGVNQEKEFTINFLRLISTERARYLTLWGIVILGLVLRLIAAGEWNATHPNSHERLCGDELDYNSLALALLNGSFFERPSRVPLYPIWLAGVHWLTKQSYSAIPYVQVLLGITVIPLTFSLGRRLFGHSAALIAAFLVAISHPLISQPNLLQTEVLYTPIILLVLITLWDAIVTLSTVRFFWAGFWVGISILVRPTLLFFPLFSIVIFLILFKKRRAFHLWIIYALSAYLVIMPWAVRNSLHYRAIFPLATSNGFLWLGSPEYYHLVRDKGYSYLEVWPKKLYASDRPELRPNTITGDRYWTRRALRSIAREPLVYLKYAFVKIAYYWLGDSNVDWDDTYPFNYKVLMYKGFSSSQTFEIILARLIPIFALIAGVLLRKKWRLLFPFYALLAYCTLLHAATHAEARLSDPLQPFLMILISGTISLMSQRIAYTMSRKVN